MRIANLILVVFLLAGVVMCVVQLRETTLLQAERDRLLDAYGVLKIEDPNLFYLANVKTNHSKAFSWRLYQPLDVHFSLLYLIEDQSYLDGPTRYTGDGEISLTTSFQFSQSDSSILMFRDSSSAIGPHFSDPLAKFLNEHWDELEVVIFDNDNSGSNLETPITLLEINVPNKLFGRLDQLKIAGIEQFKKRPVFKLMIGSIQGISEYESQLDYLKSRGRSIQSL